MTKRRVQPTSLRLQIEPIVARAEHDAESVRRDLAGHEGLLDVAQGIAEAARDAKRVSRELKKILGFHRLPVLFLALAIVLFASWCYWHFYHVAQLSIALPERDAVHLRKRVSDWPRVMFRATHVLGSRESAALVAAGKVDLAFIQGGIRIPDQLERIETQRPELVLFFLREGVTGPSQIRKLLTSFAGEGSHRVALDFVKAWGIHKHVTFAYDWTAFCENPAFEVPADIDAVFVVKDPGDETTLQAIKRLTAANFHLVSPELGARALSLEYLRRTKIPPGFLDTDPPLPANSTSTYHVTTYLVARPGLSRRTLIMAGRVLENRPQMISSGEFEPNLNSTSELLQGMEAFIGILAYIGLAFLALLGIEIMTYRRRFSELDSLISMISLIQSNKDVLGVYDPAVRSANLRYLSTCSDLLGLISVIAGYYSQENTSLLYNNLLSIIHDRSISLKLNIQLKILHASLAIDPLSPIASTASVPPAP